MKLVNKVIELFDFKKKYGLHWLISHLTLKIISRLGILTEIDQIRIKYNIDSMELFSKQVAYGPFAGMKISHKLWWGQHDFSTKLVGEYEKQVLNEIILHSNRFDIFIDIGAADGYYAVGLVYSKIFKEAICFEISPVGREVIEENAYINNVVDKVKIEGEANRDQLTRYILNYSNALILCDIEGIEFDLFDAQLLKILKKCVLIIEIHPDFVKNGVHRLSQFCLNASEFFYIKDLERVHPSVHSYTEYNKLADNHKMLIFSEGRPNLMRWIALTPKVS